MEKVWLAEEKQKAELKRQKELKEKREEELKTLEIKRQIREQEELKRMEMILEEKKKRYKVDHRLVEDGQSGLILTQPSDSAAGSLTKSPSKDDRKLVIRSQYREDVFRNGHTSVFGSYYDRETKLWGYKCCKLTSKDARCSSVKLKYKRRTSTESEESSARLSKRPRPSSLGLSDSLKLLKSMDALE